MAKPTDDQQYSIQQKCDYYSRRVNDPNLSDGERKYALRRLNQLCGGKSQTSKRTAAPSKPKSSELTDGQKYAYGAGLGYGSAKSGKRVQCKEENKDSFREGYKRGVKK